MIRIQNPLPPNKNPAPRAEQRNVEEDKVNNGALVSVQQFANTDVVIGHTSYGHHARPVDGWYVVFN